MNDKIKLIERSPTTEEYRKLREAVEWWNMDIDATEAGLSNSLFSVCMESENRIIGCGRVIGDGGIYYYIQDILVLPEFQRQGIGECIMNALMGYINEHAHTKAFVGLIAAKDKSGFYKQFGFKERPLNGPGMYLVIE